MVLFMVKKKSPLFSVIALMGFLLVLAIPAGAGSNEKPSEHAPDCAVETDSGRSVSDFCKDSCKTVIDASKLLISLCTGIFVLVPLFLGSSRRKAMKAKFMIKIGFIVLSISVFTGVIVIYFIAGIQRWGSYDILVDHIGYGALIQLISFATGAVLVGFFLLLNMLQAESTTSAKFSEAQLRLLLAQAEVYKSQREYEKALALLDEILKHVE